MAGGEEMTGSSLSAGHVVLCLLCTMFCIWRCDSATCRVNLQHSQGTHNMTSKTLHAWWLNVCARCGVCNLPAASVRGDGHWGHRGPATHVPNILKTHGYAVAAGCACYGSRRRLLGLPASVSETTLPPLDGLVFRGQEGVGGGHSAQLQSAWSITGLVFEHGAWWWQDRRTAALPDGVFLAVNCVQ